jgi:predicted amidohydrolase
MDAIFGESQNAAITGSVVIKESNNYNNVICFPSGEIQHYDKRHLFTLAGIKCIQKEPKTNDYLGWKICPLYVMILRFPVFSRNTDDYDLLIYVASWPKLIWIKTLP